MKRAASIVPDHESNTDVETDFTDRVLLSLVFDITMLAKGVERVKVQVLALAKERGISTLDDVGEAGDDDHS